MTHSHAAQCSSVPHFCFCHILKSSGITEQAHRALQHGIYSLNSHYPGQLSRVSLFQAFSFCGQHKKMWKEIKNSVGWAEQRKVPSSLHLSLLIFFPAALTLCRIPNFKRLEQARAESVASSIYKHLSEDSQSSTLVQRSIAPLHKSRRNHRFYVWTSSMVFVLASNLSGILCEHSLKFPVSNANKCFNQSCYFLYHVVKFSC